MRTIPFLSRILPLAALAMLAACADAPTSSSPAGPTLGSDEELALSLDELAVQASLAGDEPAAIDFADGALAIRLGAEPTEIAVNVDGQDYRYWAVAIGIVERGGDGAELLKRAIVAWTGTPRPTSAFRVMARSDEAEFGRHDAVADTRWATGTFLNFARQVRYRAVEGSLASALTSIGGACPNAARDPRFACNLARFEMRLDAIFAAATDGVERLAVFSEAGGIAGVVVRRTDGGDGGRPTTTAQPSRPQPTRG